MRVHSVTVCADRIDVIVDVGDAEALRTTSDAAIAERAIALLPGLEEHACKNGDERTFAEEIGDTEVPHLFEHVVMELMAKAGSPRSLRGETSWDFRRDGHGIFRVSFEYDDDLVCLGAIKAASKVMSYITGTGPAPDTEAETVRLRTLRQVPASA
ncbi:MAG: hypothetical protein CVT59_02275 [Actinobacteria bacterium HGW-Actinobacteria-1]|jgi:hypothetical protein|nr:MAG: hypothetical protein CVT59_02275 [Actinobacteria bacterium HGW-Actinobacteria-1]